MALIKVRGWQLFLINIIVVPVLMKVAVALKEQAKKTPNEWDDIMAAAFESVIEFLKSPEAFEKT